MARRDRTDDFQEFREKIRREGFGTVPAVSLVDSFDLSRSVGWMENVHEIEYDINKVKNMS